MLTREEAHTSISRHRDGKFDANDVGKLIHQIYNEFEAQMKAKDEEIERLKKAIDTSIEEIEYAIKKPQYAEVYLGNAIRFLKDNE